MSRAGSADSGFTLLEMLTVLAIAALATVALLPALPSDAGALRSAERDLARQLRATRAEAIARGHPVRLGEIRLPRGITVSGNAALTFYPDGSADGARFILRGAAGERSLGVDWLTGAVTARS